MMFLNLSIGEDLSPKSMLDIAVWILTYEIPLSSDGSMRVSLVGLITALVLFWIARIVSRWLQQLFRSRIAQPTNLDPGLSYTLERMVHFVVLSLGVLLALKVGAGVDFTTLAVGLTALSVGIGLGLKEIASDVAAGFILLFERPVRVGDRIRLEEEHGLEGNVVAIDIRTTKIVTNDGLTLIVPNSKLTNSHYVNWSYRNEPVRLHIPVGVAYGSDVASVRHALLLAAVDVEKVLVSPSPSVRLVSFGDSSLDFELLVWTDEPTAHPQIRSDVNFNIERLFNESHIEIPFPRRDLRIRADVPVLLGRVD